MQSAGKITKWSYFDYGDQQMFAYITALDNKNNFLFVYTFTGFFVSQIYSLCYF